MEQKSYADLLEQLKGCFLAPTSNPAMDAYFAEIIHHFLDRVDSLKSASPIMAVKDKSIFESGSSSFPDTMSSVEEMTNLVADWCQEAIVWAHPNAQVNVAPPTSIPSVTAAFACAIYNPNIIWDAYSGHFAQAEVQAVEMLSDLVGYDPKASSGVFTFGGTGTILYGCKLGLEKLFKGRVMHDGIREDVKLVASEASHYSKLNVLGWLGIGTKNLVTIPCTPDNAMSLPHLESRLRDMFRAGEKVAAIIPTIGTTDAFGIDDLPAIVEVRDNLVEEFELDYVPHIHADAVIGWAWSVFRDYDFEHNPMGFRGDTLQALENSLERMGDLSLADSLGIDFHKTGYAPYISSAFVVKDRKDLTLLSRDPEQMPYLFQFGNYHPGVYTLEATRSGAGALEALVNIRLFGKDGYRTLIGHIVEMSEILRERLEKHSWIKVLNSYNNGPVTLFRVYPDGVDAEEAYKREVEDPAYRERLLVHNAYNRCIFDASRRRSLSGEGVLISWTDAYRNAAYGTEHGAPVSALKSFIMSPWTDLHAVETVERQILETRTAAAEECGI